VTIDADHRGRLGSRDWASEAVRRLDADENRAADGSLKHRLARSLFLYRLCNCWITDTTTVIDASSVSTAVSEPYFARFLGLQFVAVMPSTG
jgi:cysteine synthase A